MLVRHTSDSLQTMFLSFILFPGPAPRNPRRRTTGHPCLLGSSCHQTRAESLSHLPFLLVFKVFAASRNSYHAAHLSLPPHEAAWRPNHRHCLHLMSSVCKYCYNISNFENFSLPILTIQVFIMLRKAVHGQSMTVRMVTC